MAKNDEPKQSVKEPIKSLVKEIVADIVYKLAKAAAKKTAVEFRDRLKEEASRRFAEKLKETTEKRLKQTAQKLEKEFTQDASQGPEYIKQLEEGLSKRLRQYLPTISQGALKTIIIAAAGAAIAGAAVAGGIVYICSQTPPPQPQPDLVVSEITFEVEPSMEIGFPIEELPANLYQVTVQYVIANQGEAKAGESTSCICLNGVAVTENPIGTLPAGEKASYNYPLSEEAVSDFFNSGSIEIKISADAGGAVAESNEANNATTLTVNWPQ